VSDKSSSYIGELSTGYESKTVVQYDPAKTEAQFGKEHEEAVAKQNNWTKDTHLPSGFPAFSVNTKATAQSLRRIARRLASIDDVVEKEEKQASVDLSGIADKIRSIANDVELLAKSAKSEHPAEPSPEPWLEESNPQMGDEEWIDIGKVDFKDPRDQVNKPLPQ